MFINFIAFLYCRDEGENTPLHYAAAADDNSDQLVAMLIDAGADINPKDACDVRTLDASSIHVCPGWG